IFRHFGDAKHGNLFSALQGYDDRTSHVHYIVSSVDIASMSDQSGPECLNSFSIRAGLEDRGILFRMLLMIVKVLIEFSNCQEGLIAERA
ncbi:hypothetical protein BGZ73_000625, partial [Actinomortierella ambigua]